jgi:membrane protease YdiL (CAAX protease family)
MHLQFMTFLPRFFLGLILGYLFYLGKNLWYSVAAHFTNNFLALVAMRGRDPMEALDIDKSIEPGFYAGVVISAISVIGMLFLISRSVDRQKYLR